MGEAGRGGLEAESDSAWVRHPLRRGHADLASGPPLVLVQMDPEPCLQLANGLVSKALDHNREVTAGAVFHLDGRVRLG